MNELAVLLVLTALVVVALGWLATERVAQLRLAVRDRVVVNLDTGQAITGVLWGRRGRVLVLRGAALLEPGATNAKAMDGDVLVDRDMVLFVQRLPAG